MCDTIFSWANKNQSIKKRVQATKQYNDNTSTEIDRSLAYTLCHYGARHQLRENYLNYDGILFAIEQKTTSERKGFFAKKKFIIKMYEKFSKEIIWI